MNTSEMQVTPSAQDIGDTYARRTIAALDDMGALSDADYGQVRCIEAHIADAVAQAVAAERTTHQQFMAAEGKAADQVIAAERAAADHRVAEAREKTLTEAAAAICPLCAMGAATITTGDTYHTVAGIQSSRPCRAARIVQLMILDEIAAEEARNV